MREARGEDMYEGKARGKKKRESQDIQEEAKKHPKVEEMVLNKEDIE